MITEERLRSPFLLTLVPPPDAEGDADRAEMVAFCIGFCTLQGSVTASGPASRPRRNDRFLHRVLHASRKRNSLRTCVQTAPK